MVDIGSNGDGAKFVCETLADPLSHKDILTQSTIIFWMLLNVSRKAIVEDPFQQLLECFHSKDLGAMLAKSGESSEMQELEPGILQMAKIRGFVLTLDKAHDVSALISREIPGMQAKVESRSIGGFILTNCEKNEGLQKLYSFHTLESVMAKLDKIGDASWLRRLAQLVIKNFEYPLHSVSSCCEQIMRGLLSLCSKE